MGNYSGRSVSSAGDVNGDGFDDLIVGAFETDPNRSDSGSSYVVFGRNFMGGADTADTLTANQGPNAIDILIGGRGNDTLISDGGHDVLLGGAGGDVLAIADINISGTRRLVGGNGSDTLRLDGNGLSLNLTTIPDNRILGIETIDITGSGDNVLTVSQREVLNLSKESNTLKIKHNRGDQFDIGTGWRLNVPEIKDGGFVHLLKQGAAVIKVANDVPFQNPLNKFDNDFDGFVAPVDVLIVINALRRLGSVNAGDLKAPTSISSPAAFRYYDVDGDNGLAPLDVLLVINFLVRQSRGGEGERNEERTPQSIKIDFPTTSPFSMSTAAHRQTHQTHDQAIKQLDLPATSRNQKWTNIVRDETSFETSKVPKSTRAIHFSNSPFDDLDLELEEIIGSLL